MTDSIESLGPAQALRLEELEQAIDRGLHAFVRVGAALREIRDSRLYLQAYDNFADYCQHRWDFTRQRGYQLIESAEVVETLSKTFDTGDVAPPRNDAQARALAPLRSLDGEGEAIKATWKTLREEHGENLTAEHVTQAVRQRLSASPTPPPQQASPTPPPAPPPREAAQERPETTLHAALLESEADDVLKFVEKARAAGVAILPGVGRLTSQLRAQRPPR